jgi:hypothetical protein
MTTLKAQLSSLEQLKQSGRWLNAFARDVNSQWGEDGIIEKALSVLPRNHWCVEFGAWDGKLYSSSFRLVEHENYHVVLIEGDTTKYRELCASYPHQERALFVNQYVGWSDGDGLDSILAKTQIPVDFDFLSIDVDGNDFHIWKAVQVYRPKLVLVEYNPTALNRFDFVQPADPHCNVGSSPAALVRLAKEKGYELICVTKINLLLVDSHYFELFHIPDNSLAVMREEEGYITALYVGYDGSLRMDGPALLCWHGQKLRLKQPLPWFLRRFPPAYNLLQKVLLRLYSVIFRRAAVP